jgi:hypothetical protein
MAPLDLSLGELSPVADEAGFKSARSAILTRAATDRTPSVSLTPPRCTFTVALVHAELGRDLLVHQARDNEQHHHLPLS